MLTAALVSAALLAGSQATVVASAPSPGARAAPPPSVEAQGETRRVCRLVRATGSNLQQRVCRNVAPAGAQDQQTREFMHNLQRVRVPDEG